MTGDWPANRCFWMKTNQTTDDLMQKMGAKQDKQQQKKEYDDFDSYDYDFMSDLHAAMLLQSPKGARVILWGACVFFIVALLWTNYAQLDEITRGEGKVIPSQQVQVIQNLEGGILAKLLIKEGDTVEAQQILLRIDDTNFASSLAESHLRYLSLKIKANRLRAEADNTKYIIPEDIAKEVPKLVKQEEMLFKTRRNELHNNIEILHQQVKQKNQERIELTAKKNQLQRSLKLLARELALTKPLVDQGAVSEVEMLRLERDINDLRGQLEGANISITRIEYSLLEVKSKKEEVTLHFQNQARMELNETMTELSQITESQRSLKDRVNRTEVRSPVHGTIKQIKVNTIGGVIQPGMDLLEIVPLDDTLLIEAKIRPEDIGFLNPKQKAMVKFTAYDFAIYGGVEGSVEHISADTLENESGDSFYLIRIRTNKSYLGTQEHQLPIIPGMLTSVDIVTGKKTVLEYLMKPILRATSIALSER